MTRFRLPRIELSKNQRLVGFAALAAAAVVIPPLLPGYWQEVLFFPIGMYVLLAVGLNVVVGAAGMLDLGYVAFFAVGAYTTAILTTTANLDPWLAIPLAVAAAMISGVVLGAPTLRLRGDYLAIVTLGFGEIVRIIALNTNSLGEARGITGIAHVEPFGIRKLPYYYLCLVGIAIALTVSVRLNASRVGRSWSAIREDEEAAELMGVPTFKMRLWAFTVGASIAGLAGWLYATKVSFISPDTFPFFFSVIVLSAVVLGGSGSLFGVVAGGFLIAFLPEYLRDAAAGKTITRLLNTILGSDAGNVTDFRVFLFGVALILVMVFRPRGLIPARLGGMVTTEAPTSDDLEAVDPGIVSHGSSVEGTPCLSIENLTVDFGGVRALDSVSIDVATHSIVGVIGPNGAGKTTLFNAITGVVEPTSGDIRLDGNSVVGNAPHKTCHAGIARTFQNIRLFPDLSARTNVAVGLDAHHKTSVPGALGFGRRRRTEEREAKARAEKLLAFVGLAGRGDAAGSLPYGDQRRLEIARALATSPCLLLLDEPGAGMNSTEKAQLIALVRRIRDAGLTVVLIEHDMNLVMGLVEEMTVLDFGKAIARGTPAEVQANQAVIEAYLGVDDGAA